MTPNPKKTPTLHGLQLKIDWTAQSGHTTFAVRFDAYGHELGWSVPADNYVTHGEYLSPVTAYYVKYDAHGNPYEIKGVNGYDCVEEALLLSLAANAVQPAQSQEDSRLWWQVERDEKARKLDEIVAVRHSLRALLNYD